MEPVLVKRIKVGCLAALIIAVTLLIVIIIPMYKLVERAYVIPDYDRRILMSATDAFGPLTQTVRCVNSEGEQVPGWYHMGDNGAAVIILHGLGGTRTQLVDTAKIFLDDGFGVLLIDQSGHGEHPAEINTFGPRESIDALAACEWLRNRDEVDPDRIGIFGTSMGGTTGLYAALQDPNLGCALVDSSYADLEEQAYHDLSMGFRGFSVSPTLQASFIKIFLLISPHFIGKWADYPDPVDVLGEIQCPLFISHGDCDARIGFDQYERLVSEANRNGMEITTYIGQGHDHCQYLNDPAYINQYLVFFRRNLLGDE